MRHVYGLSKELGGLNFSVNWITDGAFNPRMFSLEMDHSGGVGYYSRLLKAAHCVCF